MVHRGETMKVHISPEDEEHFQNVPGSSFASFGSYHQYQNCSLIGGTFIINFLVPTAMSSLSVFMLHMDKEMPADVMFLVPVVNLVSINLTELLLKYLLVALSINFQYVLLSGVILVTLIITNGIYESFVVVILTYGLTSGIGTGILLAYSDNILEQQYPTYRGLIMGLNLVASAIGYVVLPMVLHMLTEVYKFQRTAMISGLVIAPLYMIAVILLMRWKKTIEKYGLTSNRESLSDFAANHHHTRNNFSMNSHVWKSPNQTQTDDSDGSTVTWVMENRTLGLVRQISILPKIIEESEEIDETQEESQENVLATLDQSEGPMHSADFTIGDNSHRMDLDGCNSIPHQKEENTNDCLLNEKDLKENNSKQSQPCQEKLDSLIDCVEEDASSSCSLKASNSAITNTGTLSWKQIFIIYPIEIIKIVPRFLPVFWTKFSVRFCAMAFTVLLPTASKKITPSNTNEAAMSGLMIAAFSSLVALTLMQFCRALSNHKQKFVLLFGCLLEASGFYTLTISSEEDEVKIGACLYGLGATMIACSIQIVILDVFTQKPTPYGLQIILDLFSIILMIIASTIVRWIWSSSGSILNSFYFLTAIHVMSGLVWMPLSCTKLKTICKTKHVQEQHTQQP